MKRKNQNLPHAIEDDSSDEEFDLLPEKRQHCIPCVSRMLIYH
jgi:hypothetical protein